MHCLWKSLFLNYWGIACCFEKKESLKFTTIATSKKQITWNLQQQKEEERKPVIYDNKKEKENLRWKDVRNHPGSPFNHLYFWNEPYGTRITGNFYQTDADMIFEVNIWLNSFIQINMGILYLCKLKTSTWFLKPICVQGNCDKNELIPVRLKNWHTN